MSNLIPNFISNAGAKAAGALRLSTYAQAAAGAAPTPVAAPAPTADAAPAMRLLQYSDNLSLSATPVPAPAAPVAAATPAPAAPAVQPAAPATAKVGVLGARALAANDSLAAAPATAPTTPAPTPAPAAVTPETPAPTPAPVVPTAPAFAPTSAEAQVQAPIAQAQDADAAFKAAEELLIAELEKRHSQPKDEAPKADPKPADKPEAKPEPKPEPKPADTDASKLKDLKPEELARLGREDKKGFFDALRPAAEEAEKKYGVPAAITLAQAALETGWAQHIIPGYNIFGIKGTGPAGTTKQGTWEVYSGKKVTISANFAKYNDFYEAVLLHGKLFHNGYYDKAINAFEKDHDVFNFAKNITGVYATDPSYATKLSSIIRQYHLV